MSAISRNEVAHLAMLSRVALNDDELDQFAAQLDAILEHVKVVTEISGGGSDVEPLTLPQGNVNRNRADTPVPGLTPDQALSGAPAQEQSRFVVPQILGEGQ